MGNIIGIDLGTTFSAVSQLDNTGRANIVHNLDGDNITPSVVRFNSANESDVGVEPKKFLGLGFKDIFSRFKRDMGQEIEYETSFGNKVSPRDLSALVLKKLVQDTEETIGKIDSAVITVPANFPNNAREDTLNAGKQVGLNISNIINEPTAAAIYYAKNSGESLHGNICVFDLGGGTFDVSILKIEGNDINVIGSEGVFNLGGTDFDQKIYDLILSKVNQNTFDNNEFTLNDAEDLKRTLSKRKEAIARVGGRNIKITIEEFEDSIKGYLNQIETMCSIVMEEIDLNPTDINKVILAGGSTRMPCIKNGINIGQSYCRDCRNSSNTWSAKTNPTANPQRMYVNGKYVSTSHPLHKPGRFKTFEGAAFSALKGYEKTPEGYVYIIANPSFDGWLKVGMAIDAEDRCNGYQTSSPHRDYKLLYARKFNDRRTADT